MSSIKNLRLSTDDAAAAAPKRRFLTRLTAVLVGGMFLDGYILGIIGTVIGTISTELSFTPLWEGLTVASSLLGILVGSLPKPKGSPSPRRRPGSRTKPGV
ncbi:hypothetical protein LFT45_10905 [Arthrobacter sp. FW305-BF8]|uniref:hypothetical protein n=1 Tax=Arthrobacter sp. FW305-BF8 TaxID=2879617 RepID=UPI001F335BF1|nr:hypothetical protein [Arthrobacter sp. FW305-BF8]UKA56360.1 hypothetical protein LFT45_10905 [Arthrobacter sp. FW305-BF8]